MSVSWKIAVGWFATSAAAIQLWKALDDIPSSVPASCRSPLTYNITCDVENLITAHDVASGLKLVGEAADVYCSSTCRTSLQTFATNVKAGCGHTMYTFWHDNALQQSGQALAENFVWAQDLVCIQDSTGFCLADLYDGKKEACSDCSLKYGAALQGSEYGRARMPEDDFKSILSECAVPADEYPYTYTPGAPTPTTSEPAAPTPTCGGATYTVVEGDSCESISLAQSVATDRMIMDNYLDSNCTTLAVGLQLCIQDTCTLATIQKNQTCDDIVGDRGFSVNQLTSWNPALKAICDSRLTPNLDTLAGRHICIAAPGDYDFPTTGEPASQPTWTLTSSMFTGSWESGVVEATPTRGLVTLPPDLWDPEFTPPAVEIIINETEIRIIEDRTKDCWIIPEDYDHGYDIEAELDACQDLWWQYCFANLTLPSPPALTSAPAACTPDRSWYGTDDPEPVETPSPIQDDMTEGCNKFHKVASGDQCSNIVSTYDIVLADFYAWNPAVNMNGDCGGLWVDTYVCVGVQSQVTSSPTPTPGPTSTPVDPDPVATPTPIQEGMTEGCINFHLVVSGDQCGNIASTYGIALADFYTWNPAVNQNGACGGLWLDTWVCVGIQSQATSSPTTIPAPPTSTAADPITTPTPIREGMTEGCVKFHKVVSGDQCGEIAETYNISLANFYAWNPEVNTNGNCGGLWLDTYFCVGVDPQFVARGSIPTPPPTAK